MPDSDRADPSRSSWRRIEIRDDLCERMIGFSIPVLDTVLVVSYEGVHLVHLGDRVTIETDENYPEYALYDPERGTARYRGQLFAIIGLHGGEPLMHSPQGESLSLDADASLLRVTRNGETTFTLTFGNFSGDWSAATFSGDGRFIVIGCPYGFDFVVLERVGPDDGVGAGDVA